MQPKTKKKRKTLETAVEEDALEPVFFVLCLIFPIFAGLLPFWSDLIFLNTAV